MTDESRPGPSTEKVCMVGGEVGGVRSRGQWTGYRAFYERDALPSSKRRTRRDCCGKWHDLPSLPFLEKYSVKLSVLLSFWRWICVCSRYTSG